MKNISFRRDISTSIRFRHFILCIALFLASLIACKVEKPPFLSGINDDIFTNYFKKSSGWIAGDGAYSIPLASGKSLWTFGDSHIDDFDNSSQTTPCLFQVRNAGLLMNINNPEITITLTGSGNPPSYFAVGSDNNYWFWPGCGYEFGDTVYVFLQRVHKTGSGGQWGFEGVDSNYVACISNGDFANLNYRLLPSKSGISFTTSIIKEQDSTCYIYGIRSNGFGNDLFVARFKADSLFSPWKFYSGTSWTSNINDIRKIHEEFTASFYVCKINGKFILITTEFSVNCDQGKNIYVATSDTPYGPFTNKHSIWEVNDKLQGHYPMFYLANAHPEFDNNREELLITYCINGYGDCVNTCVNNRSDPNTYRPKAIRVPFKSLLSGK